MAKTAPQPRRVTYKSWAGIKISGTREFSLLDDQEHMLRAVWLTSSVEVGGKYGAVQGYDGCGMSAGLEHKIALYPKSMTQGSLWGLLANLPRYKSKAVEALIGALENKGWYLDAGRGVLRYRNTGAPVAAADIREEFSPPGGVVPVSGPSFDKAVKWALLWHEAFSDPVTFREQIIQAKAGLLNSHKDLESKVYKKYCGLEDASAAELGKNISPELDLAMCVYHSFSVNAPSKARKVLEDALKTSPEKDFCKKLISGLGKNDYANWKQRYKRTREILIKSDGFSKSLFGPDGIAPENL